MSKRKRVENPSWSLEKKARCMIGMYDNKNIARRNLATRLMSRMPSEITDNILERSPIVAIFDLLDDQNVKHQHRIKDVARNNNLRATSGKDTNWIQELNVFISSLINKPLSAKPKYTGYSMADMGADFEISGQILYNGRLGNIGEVYQFNFKLYRPTNEALGFRRLTRILRMDIRKQERDLMFIDLQLGNRYDLETTEGKECFETSLRISSMVVNLAFDDEDNVYYLKRNNVFRQSLLVQREPELLFTVQDGRWPASLVVGKGVVFTFIPVGVSTHYIFCYDMDKKQLYKEEIESLINTTTISAHGKSYVATLPNKETIIYTLRNDVLHKKVIPRCRRQRLNRDTHLILVDEGRTKMALKTLSIINDEVIEQFVQYCKERCVFKRETDNIFSVYETHWRFIWFQEKAGDVPYLIRKDPIVTLGTRKRQHSM